MPFSLNERDFKYASAGLVRATRNGFDLECIVYTRKIDEKVEKYFFDIYVMEDRNSGEDRSYLEAPEKLRNLCNDAKQCHCMSVYEMAFQLASKHRTALHRDLCKHRCKSVVRSHA